MKDGQWLIKSNHISSFDRYLGRGWADVSLRCVQKDGAREGIVDLFLYLKDSADVCSVS